MFLIGIFLLASFKYIYKFVKNCLHHLGVLASDPKGNPFLKDARLPIKPLVINQNSRDSVLKQGFKVEKIPNDLDAIVIGSGIGGLSPAALLSKVGKKVLVLEQHDQAGGCCHTFSEKGYEFDVGIHYVGGMHFQSLTKTYLDQISDGQIQWEKLDEEFDNVVFKNGAEKPKVYSIMGGIEKQKKNLKAEFPDEATAIDKFYNIVHEVEQALESSMFIKVVPIWLVKLIDYFGIINWFTKFYVWNKRTVKEVVDELTSNQILRDIFAYHWSNYGVVPSEAGFPMQALLTTHFAEGASYPVGGASQIAHSIIPVIERGGGKVLVHAEVLQILVSENGKAVGVKVRHGKQEHDIFAPIVISNAGIFKTEKFLQKQNGSLSQLSPIVPPKDSVGLASIFVGFDAPASELEVSAKNYWVHSKNDVDKLALDYLNMSKEECEQVDVPVMFISFPSTKDSSWEKRYPGKTTMVIIIITQYGWFKEYEKKPCLRRGDDYEALKKTLGWKAINSTIDLFPKIKDHIDYVNIGTPLSNNFYLGSTKGAVYGLDHNRDKFSLMNNAKLRPSTKIPGLYLTGQDICNCGLVGAMMGGLMCAQQILDRNLIQDLTKLHIELKELGKDSKKEN